MAWYRKLVPTVRIVSQAAAVFQLCRLTFCPSSLGQGLNPGPSSNHIAAYWGLCLAHRGGKPWHVPLSAALYFPRFMINRCFYGRDECVSDVGDEGTFFFTPRATVWRIWWGPIFQCEVVDKAHILPIFQSYIWLSETTLESNFLN